MGHRREIKEWVLSSVIGKGYCEGRDRGVEVKGRYNAGGGAGEGVKSLTGRR